MANFCDKCGRKLTAFNKVKTKNGLICKQCAKTIRTALDGKDIDFSNKSLEDLEATVEIQKKKNKKLILIPIIMVVFGIGLLAVGGLLEKGSPEDPKQTSQTMSSSETTATQPTTSDLNIADVSNNTRTRYGDVEGERTLEIYSEVEKTEENKEQFISDSIILVGKFLETSREEATNIVKEAVSTGSSQHGNRLIVYSDDTDLEGKTFRISVFRKFM